MLLYEHILLAFTDTSSSSALLLYYCCYCYHLLNLLYKSYAAANLQAGMDKLVQQMKVEREMFEKTQEDQKVIRERQTTAAAVHIQTSFRGYWYDSVTCCLLPIAL